MFLKIPIYFGEMSKEVLKASGPEIEELRVRGKTFKVPLSQEGDYVTQIVSWLCLDVHAMFPRPENINFMNSP
jgi:hypothetical protein